MALIKIDASFTDAKEYAKKESEPISEGPRELRITKADLTQSKESGKDMIAFELTSQGNVNPDDNNKTLYYYGMLPGQGSRKGYRSLVDIATAAGVAWTSDGLDTDEFIGKTVMVNIVHEIYKDRVNGKISSFV
jgi:hypothetical protein